jgi:anti-sigma regulatory factor (Ser/Thr protein kinase)
MSPVALEVKAYAAAVLGESGAGAVELALVEALTNAIKHGSICGRATGQIAVTAHVEGRAVVIEVVDTVPVVPEGLLEKAGAHRFEVNLDDLASLEESGRGLSIMVLVMDEVTLRTANDKYVLRMVKYMDS